jgi:hypothetical protein
MEHAFRALEDLIAAPRIDWRALLAAAALRLGGNLATGIAIGLGVAAGLSWAG